MRIAGRRRREAGSCAAGQRRHGWQNEARKLILISVLSAQNSRNKVNRTGGVSMRFGEQFEISAVEWLVFFRGHSWVILE
jgi:hypothetical protein